jgi:large conductance mechanosensitive channel
MSIIKEFKEFALRGNVIDLAVAVIIGAAFTKIINSAIEDLIMPPIGRVVGNVDFSNLYVPLSDKITSAQALFSATNTVAATVLPLADAKKLGPVFAYGNFITVLVNFLILSFCIFLTIKIVNKLKRKEEAKLPTPTKEEALLAEIRDILKAK